MNGVTISDESRPNEPLAGWPDSGPPPPHEIRDPRQSATDTEKSATAPAPVLNGRRAYGWEWDVRPYDQAHNRHIVVRIYAARILADRSCRVLGRTLDSDFLDREAKTSFQLDLLRSPWQPEPALADEAKALIRAAYDIDPDPADFDPENMA